MLEFIGYVTRVIGHYDPNNNPAYICQLVVLVFAPAFFMAGIYYQLGIFIRIYGRQWSILGPRMTSYAFIVIDVLSIFIQAAGGGIASSAYDSGKSMDGGKNTMVGGLVVQVIGTTGFLVVLNTFLYRAWKHGLFTTAVLVVDGPVPARSNSELTVWPNSSPRDGDPAVSPRAPLTDREPQLPEKSRTLVIGWWFPLAILAATVLIYIRSIYRVVEMAVGWNGTLMYHEAYFLTFETLLVVIAILCLSIFHPGFTFGRGNPTGHVMVPGTI